MLCPSCNARHLKFQVSEIFDLGTTTSRPDVVSITCESVGTGGLSRCSFQRGSDIFNFLVKIYWMEIENDRAIMFQRRQNTEQLQSLMFELFRTLQEKSDRMDAQARRDKHAEQKEFSDSERSLPGLIKDTDDGR